MPIAETAHEALDLALRAGLPFSGLRDFHPDPRLFRYVPLSWAVQQRIVPMLVVGDTLKVASPRADPDVSLIHTRFPYLAVDIVIAPGNEIDLVLLRAQGAT
jgi:hypothetical protein